MAKKKKDVNYLDYIPVHSDKHTWEQSEDGVVTIFEENKGAFNRIAQLIFKKPKVSQIHLQGMGNFIYPIIDGQKTIYEIGKLVKEEYGEEAEPLYERLVQYMNTLKSYGFISFK